MRKLRGKIDSRKIKDATSSVVESIQAAPKMVRNSAVSLADGLLATKQGLLASNLSNDLNGLLQGMVRGPATIYDKAMDATYNATGIGGGSHRLFDDGHTIGGAIEAVRNASPDDTVIQEAMGFVQGIFRDMTTAKGLPLANWDKPTYDHVAGFLESQFHIPKDWFYDLNSYDAAELLGGVTGVVATALCWSRADTERFSHLVGGMGVSAVVSANPLLLVVTVVALAKAFHQARQSGDYADFADGVFKGGIGSGSTLVVVSQVGVLGGPAGVALLVGLSTGVLVNMATRNVSVVQIGQFMAERAKDAAAEVKKLADCRFGGAAQTEGGRAGS